MDSVKKVFTHSTSGGKPTLTRVNALGKSTSYAAQDTRESYDPFVFTGDGRNEERVDTLLDRIGITRVDMLGIPAAAWEARMSRPASAELTFDRQHPEEYIPKSTTNSTSRSMEVRSKSLEPSPLSTRTLGSPPAIHRRSLDVSEGRQPGSMSERTETISRDFAPTTDSGTVNDDVDIQSSLENLQAAQSRDSTGNPPPQLLGSHSTDSQTSDDGRDSNYFDSFENRSTTSESEVEDRQTSPLTKRLSWNKWKKLELLGTGSFGAVYKAVGSDGNFFAAKEVSLLNSDEQNTIQLQQEIAVLSHCHHDNIVQYLGTERHQDKLYIFLELVTQGSLVTQYRSYPLFDEQIRSYTRQILHGLKYLHDRKVVHRDIKCANILVHAHATVKLADFGMAKQLENIDSMRSCKGSVYWMAPEVIHPRKTAGFPADIWSLGCTVLEMAARKPPFSDWEWHTVFWKVAKGEVPPIPDFLHEDARSFIAACLQVDPSERPTATALLEHPFVRPCPRVSMSVTTESVTFHQQEASQETWTVSSRTDSLRSARSVRTRPSIFEKEKH